MKPPISSVPKIAAGILPWGWVLVSLLVLSTTNDPALIPQTAAWSLLLGLALFRIAFQAKAGKPALPLGKLLSLFLGLLSLGHFISFFAATNQNEAWVSILHWLPLAMGCWVMAWDWQERGEAGKMQRLKALVVLGLLQGLIAWFQKWGVEAFSMPGVAGVPIGTSVNPNLLGTMVVLTLPAAGLLMIRSKGYWRGISAAQLLLGASTAYISGSRAAMLILLLWSLVLIPFLPRWLSRTNAAIKPWMGGIAGIGLVVGLAVLLYVGWGRKQMPQTYQYLFAESPTIEPGMSTAEVRMVLWNYSAKMGISHPFTGVGAGNWKVVIPKYGVKADDASGNYGMVYFLRPHNDFLGYFAETGILGLIGFVGLIITGIYFGLKTAFQAKESPSKWTALVGALGVMGYGGDAFFGFPGERVIPLVFLAFYLSLAWEGRAPKGPIWGRKMLALFGGLLLVMGILNAVRIGPDMDIHRMLQAKSKKDWAKVVDEAEKGEGFLSQLDPQTAIPLAWYKGLALLNMGKNEAGLVEMKRAAGQAPYNLAVRTNLAAAYALTQDLPSAIAGYQSLVKDFKGHYEAETNLAICLVQAGNNEEAKAVWSGVPANYPTRFRPVLDSLLGK